MAFPKYNSYGRYECLFDIILFNRKKKQGRKQNENCEKRQKCIYGGGLGLVVGRENGFHEKYIYLLLSAQYEPNFLFHSVNLEQLPELGFTRTLAS